MVHEDTKIQNQSLKKQLFIAASTYILLIWIDMKRFKQPFFAFFGVKLMIVDKPQIPTNIALYGSIYEP